MIEHKPVTILRIKDAKHWKKLYRSKKWQSFQENIPDEYFPLYTTKENPTILLSVGMILEYTKAAIEHGDIIYGRD